MRVGHGNRDQACLSKIKYLTRSDVKNALRDVRKAKTIEDVDSLRVYKCPYCPGYHIGRKQ